MRIALPVLLATAAAAPVHKIRMRGSLPFGIEAVSNDLALMERSGGGDGQGFVVSGLIGTSLDTGQDMAELNGKYWMDKDATEEQRGFKHVGGKWTIWYYSGYGEWRLSEGYGGSRYYYCVSASLTPPLTGWKVYGNGATEPPPSISLATPAQARPLPATAASRTPHSCVCLSPQNTLHTIMFHHVCAHTAGGRCGARWRNCILFLPAPPPHAAPCPTPTCLLVLSW
jgi:hypothetical protein